MENHLTEITILIIWIIKEALSSLLEKKSFKKVIEENREHIEKNTKILNDIILGNKNE